MREKKSFKIATKSK